MARSLRQLEQLGQCVASALEEAAPERARAIETGRRGFLRHELGGSERRVLGGRPAWLGGVAFAVLAAAAFVLIHRRAPITFEIDGALGVTNTWLAAPQGAPLSLGFSEGTKVRLEAASRARVADLDAHGASLALEGGHLHAEVVHKVDSAWKVVAGPFTVNVTGTVFDVNWDPNSEELAVSVSRGSVRVWDSSTGSEQAVRASETLRATAAQHHLVVARSEASSERVAAGPAPVVRENVAPDNAPVENATADARDATNTTPDSVGEPLLGKSDAAASEWREFAKRGALREAFASAEVAGFARTCASASSAELLLLGDGARLSGKPERAMEALLTLRRRYPGDPRRAAAAFSLGKVSFDQRGAYEQAAEWFSTSIREQPGGPLAREASGRLIEALRRADDSAGARRAARDYLSKYPEGPHADLARSVLR